MKFIQFKRNQANAADKLQLPTEGIISISSASITSALIIYTPILKVDADAVSAPEALQYTLTLAATGLGLGAKALGKKWGRGYHYSAVRQFDKKGRKRI